MVKPNMNTNKCRRCGKHYMSGKQLEAHINKVHADDRINREGGNTWVRNEVTRISAGNREMTHREITECNTGITRVAQAVSDTPPEFYTAQPEQLSRDTIWSGGEDITERYYQLIAQRDELLACARRWMGHLEMCHSDAYKADLTDVRAAIANAERSVR